MSQQYSTKFIKKEKVAQDAYSFYFERPKGLDFAPGQFLRLTLDISNPDSRGPSRFFSIASSPTEDGYLMIATRIIQSAFKKALYSLNGTDVVKITAPFGKFILKENETNHCVFLAGGIGITPFRSMIRNASDKKLSTPITCFTSFRTVQDSMFGKELHEIAKNNPSIKLVETITQPEKSTLPWNGLTGRIDADLIKSHVSDISLAKFYLCGPPNLINGLTDVVRSLEVDDDRIFAERFTGY